MPAGSQALQSAPMGSPRCFSRSYLTRRWQRHHIPMRKETSPKLLSICKWKHREYRALKQIRLPVLKMGSHQKSLMPSTFLSTNSALQCETPTWPCSQALQWWSKLITLVPLLSPASMSQGISGRNKEKSSPNEKCCRDMHLLPWNRREQILKPGGFWLVIRQSFPAVRVVRESEMN